MNNRDDSPEKKKGNTDKRHEPKDARHEDRLARGDIGMPGPGGNKFSAQSRGLGLEDRQRGERNFSRDNQLGAQLRGEKNKQNALSKEFKEATNLKPKDSHAERKHIDRSRDHDR